MSTPAPVIPVPTVGEAAITYPLSVQHFLLIGSLGFLLGTIFFLFLTMRYSSSNKTIHYLIFFTAAIATAVYYAQWTGMGVFLKTNDTPARLIFWSRYVDHFLTFPLILLTLGLLAKSNTSTLVSLVGNGLLMVAVQFVGALVLAPYKYIWWTAGVAFYAIVIVQLVIQLSESQRLLSPSAVDSLKVLTILLALTWAVYPIVWVLGTEGIDVMHLTVEVGILTLVDWASKLGLGGFVLMQREAFDDVDTLGETTKLRPTSELV